MKCPLCNSENTELVHDDFQSVFCRSCFNEWIPKQQAEIESLRTALDKAVEGLKRLHTHEDGQHREICICPPDCWLAALIAKLEELKGGECDVNTVSRR